MGERQVNDSFRGNSKPGEQKILQQMEELVMLQLCFGLSVILFGLYAWNREQPH